MGLLEFILFFVYFGFLMLGFLVVMRVSSIRGKVYAFFSISRKVKVLCFLLCMFCFHFFILGVASNFYDGSIIYWYMLMCMILALITYYNLMGEICTVISWLNEKKIFVGIFITLVGYLGTMLLDPIVEQAIEVTTKVKIFEYGAGLTYVKLVFAFCLILILVLVFIFSGVVVHLVIVVRESFFRKGNSFLKPLMVILKGEKYSENKPAFINVHACIVIAFSFLYLTAVQKNIVSFMDLEKFKIYAINSLVFSTYYIDKENCKGVLSDFSKPKIFRLRNDRISIAVEDSEGGYKFYIRKCSAIND